MIDLKQVTFCIPYFRDSKDREENLLFLLEYLTRWFDTNIIIKEAGTERTFEKFIKGDNIRYEFEYLKPGDPFHRTRYLNEMCDLSDTDILANQDTDVIVPIHAYVDAVVEIAENGADFVYPYDGRFLEISRSKIDLLRTPDGFYAVSESELNCLNPNSVGGLIFQKKSSFVEAGKENQKFKIWGFEDNERIYRWQKLGYKIVKLPNYLIHLEHQRGQTSSEKHPHYISNIQEFYKVNNMSEIQLREYIKTWNF